MKKDDPTKKLSTSTLQSIKRILKNSNDSDYEDKINRELDKRRLKHIKI